MTLLKLAASMALILTASQSWSATRPQLSRDAEIKIDLAANGQSRELADLLSGLTERVVLDGESGACDFRARIVRLENDGKEAVVCVALTAHREGSIDCRAEGRGWMEAKLVDYSSHPGVRVESASCAD